MLYSGMKKIYYSLERKRKQAFINRLEKNGLLLGENVEFIANVFLDPSHCYLISIGDNCTICPNVRLIAHDASTKKILNYTKLGKIEIKENCFIGDSAIILPGVKIGPGSIIGAGAVVTKNIPPNMIAVGNPAKIISSVEKYLTNIKMISKNKKIFNEEYFIGNLNSEKRQEIIKSVGDSIGFIV